MGNSFAFAFAALFASLPLGCAASPPPRAPLTPAAAGAGEAGFDRSSAADVLDELQEDASRCGSKASPTGAGRATVVFDGASGVAKASVTEAPFAGTQAGACVERVFGAAKVPTFRGAPVTVRVGFLVTPEGAPPGFSVRSARKTVGSAVAQCNLALRAPREVGADEIDVHFAQNGSVRGAAFYRFEDHEKLETNAAKCIKKTLAGSRIAAFASDEEHARVKVYFSDPR